MTTVIVANMLYKIKIFKTVNKPFVSKTLVSKSKKNIKVSNNYNLSTSTREFLHIFRKFFIKCSSFKSNYFGGAVY